MANNLRTYETVCLTKVDMTETQYKSMVEKCQKAIETEGKGEWSLVDDWGKAKISYPIQKEERAQWTYFRFKSEPAGVNEMTRSLKINENVLRQMTNLTSEDSSDYEPLKATMAKDLNDRDKVREWKDSRKRGGRPGDRDRNFKRKGREPRAESSDDSSENEESKES